MKMRFKKATIFEGVSSHELKEIERFNGIVGNVNSAASKLAARISDFNRTLSNATPTAAASELAAIEGDFLKVLECGLTVWPAWRDGAEKKWYAARSRLLAEAQARLEKIVETKKTGIIKTLGLDINTPKGAHKAEHEARNTPEAIAAAGAVEQLQFADMKKADIEEVHEYCLKRYVDHFTRRVTAFEV